MIGLVALLQLVDWYHARGPSNQQGGLSCVAVEPPLSPPTPDRADPAERPTQFWLALLAGQRERIVHALSRVVVQQLTKPPPALEVIHEQPINITTS